MRINAPRDNDVGVPKMPDSDTQTATPSLSDSSMQSFLAPTGSCIILIYPLSILDLN